MSRPTGRNRARANAVRTLARSCAAALCAATGCLPATGGWDIAALAARHPALSDTALRGHRLGDAAPHFLPDAVFTTDAAGLAPRGVRFFLCRFEPASRITAAWVTPSARHDALVRQALSALEQAIPDLAFREAPAPEAQLVIELGAPGTPTATGSGNAIADCRIAGPGNGAGDASLSARLERASIHVQAAQPDALGRERALSDEQLLGALLHELGHALGFGAHVASRDALLSSSVDGARWAGRRVARGEPLRTSTLAALHAVPSGVVVGRGRLASASATLAGRLARRAREAGWDGPFTRVGDRSGELFWLDGKGERIVLWAGRPAPGWSEPLLLVPGAAAAAELRASGGGSPAGAFNRSRD